MPTAAVEGGAAGAGVDTAGCDREPIRVPGSIQPHGVLLVLDDAGTVLRASENAGEVFGTAAREAIGRPLGGLIGGAAATLREGLAAAPADARPAFLGAVESRGRAFHALAHRTAAGVVLELEHAGPGPGPPADSGAADLHALLDGFTLRAEAAATVAELSGLMAAEARRLTGFDRALVYRFDDGWDGTVVGEDGNGRLPALLDHRFPASDIPAQARELYRLNRVRVIPDAGYRPVPLTPAADGTPLDLTFSTLRSVSPVHVEYMRNMATAASTSVSILRDGRLWGLVSCHHTEPRRVPYPARAACDLLARALSLRLAALEHAGDYERRIEVRSAYSTLIAAMADRGDFAAALADRRGDLLALADARGAAVVTEAGCVRLGEAPGEDEVRGLAGWLFASGAAEVYATDALPAVHPPAHAYQDAACGLLAVAVSKLHPSYVMWFRPEVVQTVKWGGEPAKRVRLNGDGVTLHPRRSFETWLETVRDRSLPWRPSEVEAAAELRNAVVGTVLRRAEELADLNAELARSNKELEAFSYSVSHDLRAPLRHIVGYAEMLKDGAAGRLSPREERCVATIIESSEYAGRLVDKLLGFSRLGRADLVRSRVDLNALVAETRQDVMRDAAGRSVRWVVGDLPAVTADMMMLRMAVRDLLSNAVKYTRGRAEAVVEVSAADGAGEVVVTVRDNGVGFDMKYADKLFGVFQRLHRWEDYEGTGIGLANVRRVVERHGGRAWAAGEEGVGAAFSFALPKTPPPDKSPAKGGRDAQADPAR